MNEPRLNIPEWTVSELSAALRKTVEDSYGYVRVRGEISGYRGPHSSGHCYFALKDETAKIEAVIWKGAFGRMRFKPAEGLEVIAIGRLTTYPGQSKYQIVVETLEPAGVGALMALVEERKKKLAAEGLFDPARKQLLPFLPDVIGVVTSPTGAVIRDILHRLADRFPRRVLVWPVRVQGDGSAAEVATAIHGFNALATNGPIPRPDLIIVARGGGSLEDLWSFNEEIVVRAAAESMIPLVSAVGHETDVTLIDFAADVRAPTPSAAAEMAVPVRTELLLRVDSCARRALASWQRSLEGRRTELRAAARALPDAEDLLALPRQRLDHASARLPRALIANAQLHHTAYSRLAGRLTPQILHRHILRERERTGMLARRSGQCLRVHVERRRERYAALALRLDAGRLAYVNARRTQIGRARERLEALGTRAQLAVERLLDDRAARVERAERLLAAVSYRGVLERGFALVRDLAGRPVRQAAAVSAGERIDIEFSDGRVRALAEVSSGTAPVPHSGGILRRRRRRVSDSDTGQGSLFDA
jgi:exodeoxyribonuclease VII large subunit